LANTSIETTQYDFESGKVIQSGGNPLVGPSESPIRVVSPHATNKKKVLWIRDSFGTGLSPFMAATFTETVQLHWNEVVSSRGELLVHLVNTWHPEYLVVTVVERDAAAPLLTRVPQKGHR
jgi:alginate O-acetyltransferase complex protein AlgJ